MARRAPRVRHEYDLHGLRVDEVAARLDAVIRKHAPSGEVVHIVHGRGSGALAAEVERIARVDPRVADCYRSGVNPGETILQLRPAAAPPPHAPTREGNYPIPPVRRGKRR